MLRGVRPRLGTAAAGLVVVSIVLSTATGSLAAPPAAPAWAIQATPNPTAPEGTLSGVSCASATSCMAVGSYENASATGLGLAETWNGTSWTIVAPAVPKGAVSDSVAAVSCVSASACMIAGEYQGGADNTWPLAELWNGSVWEQEPAPKPAGAASAQFLSVSCSAVSACTTVGSYVESGGASSALAERWGGKSWKLENVPSPKGTTADALSSVACPTAGACTAVGSFKVGFSQSSLAEAWTAKGWLVQTTPKIAGAEASYLSSVDCVGVGYCGAIGDASNPTGTAPFFDQWNGTAWKSRGTASLSSETLPNLVALSCASASQCTAAGEVETSGVPLTLAENWDGKTWAVAKTVSPKGSSSSQLSAVACSTAGCTAVGSYAEGGHPLALGEASVGKSFALTTVRDALGAVWGELSAVSCSKASCMAVGYYTSPENAEAPLAEVFDGTTWTLKKPPAPSSATSSELSAVSCVSPTDCVAVGSYSNGKGTFALAETWHGASFMLGTPPNPVEASVGSYLVSVSCTAAAFCMGVGDYVTASETLALSERWNGTSWKLETAQQPYANLDRFTGVSCTSASACTAVGVASETPFDALAEDWNGTTWTMEQAASPGATDNALDAVECTSASNCIAVGDYATSTGSTMLAEGWNGSTWTAETAGTPKGAVYVYVVSLSCASATRCEAVGDYQNIGSDTSTMAEGWNGDAWSVQPTPAPKDTDNSALTGVSCTGATDCEAVGQYVRAQSATLAERFA